MPPTPEFDYVIKPVTETDLPALADFINNLEAREPRYHGNSVAELTRQFHQPQMRHTTWYVAQLRNADGSVGAVIGNADFSKRDEGHTAWGELNVHPDYRIHGVGRTLYIKIMGRARISGATAFRLNPHLNSTLLIDYLVRRGFVQERYFWGMRLPAAQLVEQPPLPSGFSVRSYQPGQDELLVVAAINGSFAEHYGYEPTTAERVRGWNERPAFKPEGVLLAFSGDNLAGICVASVGSEPVEGEIVGDIHSLGTLPPYRHRGLGRALLLMGVNWLRQYVPIVELGVEGKNEKALALYASVGFRQQRG